MLEKQTDKQLQLFVCLFTVFQIEGLCLVTLKHYVLIIN